MSHDHSRLALALAAALLAVVGTPLAAFAQVVDVEAVEPEPREQVFMFHTGYDHLFETDIKNIGGADVSRDSFQAGIGGRFDISESVSLDTRFIYELNAYDFSNNIQGIAWENINQYTLAGLFDWKIDEKWHLLGGPIFRLAGEGSAAFDDGFTGGGVAGFNYVASKDFSIGFGLGLMSQLEDDPGIIPIPMMRWHFAEPFTLKVGISPLGGRLGLGPELTWHLMKELDFGVGAQYQRRRFRLDDHGFAGTRKGIGEETGAPFYLRLTYRPIVPLSVELFAGVVAAGELTIQDKDGNSTIDKGYDTTPALGLRGVYRF